MIIGITGGTGCGKTTALHAFAALGGKILDCDAIYHQLLQTDEALLCAIENRFPGTVSHGILDRKKLGNLVFSDPEALSDLNAITHHYVREAVILQLADSSQNIAIDAIGLFESGINRLCDVTVAVTAPEECRIRRLMDREGISPQYAAARIQAQRPQAEYADLCDYTLHNDSTQEAFTAKCLAFFRTLGIMDPGC